MKNYTLISSLATISVSLLVASYISLPAWLCVGGKVIGRISSPSWYVLHISTRRRKPRPRRSVPGYEKERTERNKAGTLFFVLDAPEESTGNICVGTMSTIVVTSTAIDSIQAELKKKKEENPHDRSHSYYENKISNNIFIGFLYGKNIHIEKTKFPIILYIEKLRIISY